jgi:uncharacterized protein with von Willebrand factor type A (vWA) domain
VADDPAGVVVAFADALRVAGVRSTPGRAGDALRGLLEVDLGRRGDFYWTLRQTLVCRHEDLATFDHLFAEWFGARPDDAPPPPTEAGTLAGQRSPSAEQKDAARTEATAASEDGETGWTREEILRRKDFAAMTPEELADVRVLMARLLAERPQRRTRRLRAHPRGRDLDLRRMTRSALGTGGDPFVRAFRRPVSAPRRLVLLCDVSGSMEPYARALVLFVHAAVGAGPGVEAFAFGTRLSRLTPSLLLRDPDRALAAVAARVVDWAGGTRIGESLRQFNAEWGRRAHVRGAVVVILSDGWERDDPDLIAREMARLQRVAYALVWVNPLKGHVGYQPLARGMSAALPYIDRFLPGARLSDLESLGTILAGIDRRRAA